MTESDPGSDGQTGLSVAAVARLLGVAPGTLRTWDHRYGLGPSSHRAGRHRRYTPADVARLQRMRGLLLQGVSAAEAARAAMASSSGGSGRAAGQNAMSPPDMAGDGGGGRSKLPGVTARQLREAVLRLDGEGAVALLAWGVREQGVVSTWETVVRPTLAVIAEHWTSDAECIAQEHLLSECATRVFHHVMDERQVRAQRPVLLACAPTEAHVLPLHALAAALAERSVPTRLLGAASPTVATTAAVRRIQPSALVLWAQSAETADAEVFVQVPPVRGGCRLFAAGPGWDRTGLPDRVSSVSSLPEAVAELAGDTG